MDIHVTFDSLTEAKAAQEAMAPHALRTHLHGELVAFTFPLEIGAEDNQWYIRTRGPIQLGHIGSAATVTHPFVGEIIGRVTYVDPLPQPLTV